LLTFILKPVSIFILFYPYILSLLSGKIIALQYKLIGSFAHAGLIQIFFVVHLCQASINQTPYKLFLCIGWRNIEATGQSTDDEMM
jgi:hypothetical protein